MRTKLVRSEIIGPLATFRLQGNKVHVTYHDDLYQEEMESRGVFVGGIIVRPKDGRTFFNGLERAYANSSFIIVESVKA